MKTNRELSLIMLCLALLSVNAYAQNPRSDKYIERQTFGREAFDKDNNIWVYSAKFAETFGMPLDYVQELKGFEAAAFRVQLIGYAVCGYGGKAENCAPQKVCFTDVYFDEAKTPLPWANDQQADWLAIYNSLRWIKVPGDRPMSPNASPDVIANQLISSQTTLHPFADPKTRKEVNVFSSYSTPSSGELSYSNIGVFGYKRSAVAGLTMISLSYRCGSRNSTKRDTSFRIESREKIFSPTLTRFHEFFLPEAFEKRIDEHTKTSQERDRDREFYKSITNLK